MKLTFTFILICALRQTILEEEKEKKEKPEK